MTHTQCTDRFAELVYRELDPAAEAECAAHMTGCAECREAYAALRSTLSLMDRRKRDEPDAAFWDGYWTRLEGRVGPAPAEATASKRKETAVFPLRFAWISGAAAVLLIGFGIYLGRNIFTPPGSAPAPALRPALAQRADAAPSGADSLADRTESYLERSKVLLQGIVNQDALAGSAGAVRRQRDASRQLIGEAHVLTAALKQPDQQQVRELIADLQIILLQLANIEVEPGTPAIELVRKGVDHKSILLKIRVEELKALTRRTTAASAADTLKTHL